MDQSSIATSVDTKVGQLTVYSSGLLHVTKSANLTLTYGGLVMEFVFIDDGKESRYSLEPVGVKLTCKLYNFANNLGQGRIDPVKLGTLNQRELWASFYAWTINPAEGLRLLSYVLYLGAPVTAAAPAPAAAPPVAPAPQT